MTHVERIFLLIHPLTYVDHESEYIDKEFFRLALERENTVCARWYQAIGGMQDGDLLALLPSRPETASMRRLQEFAVGKLGKRCIILNQSHTDWVHAEFWQNRADEFYQFLGRELRDTLLGRRGSASADDLTTAIQAYSYVEEMKREAAARQLDINVDTVRTESWGESFEGCVAKYSQMMSKYLGLREPVEENYEMTVPDAPPLLAGRLMEKVALDGGVRLYLFAGGDSTPIAAFFETARRPCDKVRIVDVPVDPARVEVFSALGKNLNRLEDASFGADRARKRISVPLINGVCHNDKGRVYIATFICGVGYGANEFHEAVKKATMQERGV